MEGGPGAAPRAAPGGGEALAALDMMKGAAEVRTNSNIRVMPARHDSEQPLERTPRHTAAGEGAHD